MWDADCTIGVVLLGVEVVVVDHEVVNLAAGEVESEGVVVFVVALGAEIDVGEAGVGVALVKGDVCIVVDGVLGEDCGTFFGLVAGEGGERPHCSEQFVHGFEKIYNG